MIGSSKNKFKVGDSVEWNSHLIKGSVTKGIVVEVSEMVKIDITYNDKPMNDIILKLQKDIRLQK